jgi:hypothetical protein
MKHHLLFATVLLMSAACSHREEEEANNPEVTAGVSAPADSVPVTVNDTTKFKFDFALANIPSPANSIQDLNTFGVPYDDEILHDPDKAEKYKTEQMKAINLGIYNIDMAYAMLNDRGQDVLNYMKGVFLLGDQLGLRSAVSGMVGKRAETNLNKRDSLFKLLDEIFVKSDSYLRNNERVYTASMIFAGSWLESLYLTSRITEKATEKAARQKGHRLLWEQRFHLANLIGVLNDYKDNPGCAALLKDLREIHQEITAVRQDAAMDDTKFGSISSKIAALRNRYTAV